MPLKKLIKSTTKRIIRCLPHHCIFLQFFKHFRGKNIKNSTGNEEWIESETATITSDYVLNNHLSIS